MAKRKPKKSIFIACEGTNTEPLYFENIKEIEEEDDDYPFSITIYPDRECDENPKTDALGLVNVAIESKNEFDEVWVVFDKDGYTKHKEAFQLAVENNVKIAFSSIAFEMWVLLHFERNNTAYAKSSHIIDNKFINNESYLSDYNKSSDFNVFPYIKDKIVIAYRNSAWVRKMRKSENIFDLNPYTDVDFLVKYLTLEEKVNEYLRLGETIIISNVELQFLKQEDQISLKIKNNSSVSFVTNGISFYVNDGPISFIPNNLLAKDEERIFSLFDINTFETLYINYENYIVEVNCIEAF